ncbi:hypothetical protein H8D30_06065 [bacterium]|nr:hypothetical protein [bacterium]
MILLWFGLVLVGYFVWRRYRFTPDFESALEEEMEREMKEQLNRDRRRR